MDNGKAILLAPTYPLTGTGRQGHEGLATGAARQQLNASLSFVRKVLMEPVKHERGRDGVELQDPTVRIAIAEIRISYKSGTTRKGGQASCTYWIIINNSLNASGEFKNVWAKAYDWVNEAPLDVYLQLEAEACILLIDLL